MTRGVEWVAGFLEGEGSFYTVIAKKGRGAETAMVRVGQKQLEPLLTLQDLYGGSICDSDIFRWTLCGLPAEKLMREVLPLMSPRRTEQINRALEIAEMNRKRRHRPCKTCGEMFLPTQRNWRYCVEHRISRELAGVK